MSEIIHYPAERIRRLIIEGMTADAQALGVEAAEIEIQYRDDGLSEDEVLELDGDVLYFRGQAARRVTAPVGVAVTVKQAQGDLRVMDLNAGVELESVQGALRLTELTGPVQLGRVASDIRAANLGDLRISDVCEGDLRVDAGDSLSGELITGDVRLRDMGSVRLGRVRGDLWIEHVSGALQVAHADGDVRLSDVAGPTAFDEVLGDLRATALAGGLSAALVSGDAILSGPFVAEAGYELSADGDVSLNLPADADVRLVLRAGGRIRSDVTLTPTADGSPTYTAVVGHGATRIRLTSGGDLRVTQAGAHRGAGAHRDASFDEIVDMRNLGERIRQQVQASLTAAGIASPNGEAPTRRERPRPPAPERAKPAAVKTVSTEEQMAILKMVETGAISPQEADILLRALEV